MVQAHEICLVEHQMPGSEADMLGAAWSPRAALHGLREEGYCRRLDAMDAE